MSSEKKVKIQRVLDACKPRDVSNYKILPFVEVVMDQNGQRKPFLYWPDRLVRALEKKELVPFIGAGVSLDAGVPLWKGMLDRFGLENELLEMLRDDALTPAEIAKHRKGAHDVQDELRRSVEGKLPTVSHVMLAALECPVYVTTNYDDLLEQAIQLLHGDRIASTVLTVDSDIRDRIDLKLASGSGPGPLPLNVDPNETLIFKIHGCARKETEHLVFTRSDYRTHYRTNTLFFRALRTLLASRHVLFGGFSHSDPEVTRQLETAMHDYERYLVTSEDQKTTAEVLQVAPHFYSVEFGEPGYRTEVLAARGIHAIYLPKVDIGNAKYGHSIRAAAAIGNLAEQPKNDNSLDRIVRGHTTDMVKVLCEQGLGELDSMRKEALEIFANLEENRENENTTAVAEKLRKQADEFCAKLLRTLNAEDGSKNLATQGVWLAQSDGTIVGCKAPDAQLIDERLKYAKELADLERDKSEAGAEMQFNERPYFRVAKSFRESFISDAAESIFNSLATIFLCTPVVDDKGEFRGLLFSATQPGHWKLPVELAKKVMNDGEDTTLLIVDANGVPLIPVADWELTDCQKAATSGDVRVDAIIGKKPAREFLKKEANTNKGFLFDKLEQEASNVLVQHVSNVIVPLVQADSRVTIQDHTYDVATMNVPRTSWKLAIAKKIQGSVARK